MAKAQIQENIQFPLKKRIKFKYLAIKGDFLRKKAEIKKSEEYKSLVKTLQEILISGVLVTLALLPFGVKFTLWSIPSFGCTYSLINNKIIVWTKEILSSFVPFRSYK